MGNPKKKSRFVCCKCLQENLVGSGIQRQGKQREKGHIKDLYCWLCKTTTKNAEIRYCDNYVDVMDKATELHEKYYREVGSQYERNKNDL